uniref:Peptidase M12B domain-containing protein n=1 Tax=Amblyomma maculatum TaxID=34609 RepID=G3MSF9_AMBMU
MYFISLITVMILPAQGLVLPRLVYPRLIEERSSEGRMVVRLHEDLTLNLRKASVAAPELRVLTEENGEFITRFYNGADIERDLYEDEEALATVTITKRSSAVHVKGLVGPEHRIQPVPGLAESEEGIVPHEIFELDQQQFRDKAITYRNTAQAVPGERESETEAEVPQHFYAELFVVLDTIHHRRFTSTRQALQYICITINGANLRFRATSSPTVKLVLTGVELSQEESYIVSSKSGHLFDEKTLEKLRDYALDRKAQYGYPDLVYLMTGRDVATYENGRITARGQGIGYLAGVCRINFVALGEDSAGEFSGLHTMTHELAHVLGAMHDGDSPDGEYPGHPGAARCPWRLGNLMSYVNRGPAHQKFSKCSVEQIRHVVRRAGRECWNLVSRGRILRGVYPGMAVEFREFCSTFAKSRENSTFDHATVDKQTCKVRCFFYSFENDPYSDVTNKKVSFSYSKDALDYMPCGRQEVCIQSVCVTKPSDENA